MTKSLIRLAKVSRKAEIRSMENKISPENQEKILLELEKIDFTLTKAFLILEYYQRRKN